MLEYLFETFFYKGGLAMQFMTKEVVINDITMCMYSCVYIVPRAEAESCYALPDSESVATAKDLYGKASMFAAQTLIEAIQMAETENTVLGFFFLLLDTRGPIPETLGEDLDVIYDAQLLCNASFLSLGNPDGGSTALKDLVFLSKDQNFTNPFTSATGGLLEYFIKESIALISISTCKGCS